MISVSSVAAWVLTTRSLVRAPIALYRHGFGRLLGPRLLMLEHTGRRSGLARYVCLEVVDRPAPTRLLVVSGFGIKAQWYQNLIDQPACFVTTGALTRVPATAHPVPATESESVLDRYRRKNPAAWRRLTAALAHALGHPVEALPMMELVLEAGQRGEGSQIRHGRTRPSRASRGKGQHRVCDVGAEAD